MADSTARATAGPPPGIDVAVGRRSRVEEMEEAAQDTVEPQPTSAGNGPTPAGTAAKVVGTAAAAALLAALGGAAKALLERRSPADDTSAEADGDESRADAPEPSATVTGAPRGHSQGRRRAPRKRMVRWRSSRSLTTTRTSRRTPAVHEPEPEPEPEPEQHTEPLERGGRGRRTELGRG